MPLKYATNDSSPQQPDPTNPPKAFQLTNETAFDIDPGQYQWSPDSRYVLYLFDRDPKVGDRYRLWRKEIAKPNEEAVDLLPEFSSAKRSSFMSSNGSGDGTSRAPAPPSNRTLPPGLMGDNLHIGQFFLSEKVPVSFLFFLERGGKGRERRKREGNEKISPEKKKKQDLALITVDERSPGIFDVYRLDLATGTKKRGFAVFVSIFRVEIREKKKTRNSLFFPLKKKNSGELQLDTLNPGDVASWVPDKFLRVRGARALLPKGGGVFRTRSVRSPFIDLKKRQDELVQKKKRGKVLSEEEEKIASAEPYPWVRDDAKETTEWKEVARWNSSDVFIPVSAAGHAFAFANEGKSVWVLTSANASAVRLVQLSAKTGKLEKVLAEGEKGKDEDVVATAFDASNGELAAFATERLRRKWRTTAKAWDPDSDLVHRTFNGSDEFSVASKASDNSRVILRFVSDTAPPTYYLLDRKNKRNRTLTKQITVR